MATMIGYVPLKSYLASNFEPDAEYVDGLIEERAMGEYDHASWQDALLAWFRLHAKEWGTRQKPELRVQVAPNRFRVPDVTLMAREQPIEQVLTRPPLAVFEILSPEDSLGRTMRKLAEYEAMGIAHIWVIDPRAKIYFRFSDGKLTEASHFGAPGETIHFAMSEIENYLD